MKKLPHSLGPVIVLVFLAGAFWILHHELRHYHYADITRALAEVPGNRLLLSFALTMLNYVVLTGYDALALRYIRRPLAYRRIALASFIGYALSHNIGLSIFTGSAVRYRLYAAWGLSTAQIAGVVAFGTMTLWLGTLAMGGLACLLEPMVIPAPLHLPLTSLHPIGIICLALVGAYVSWGAVRKTPITVREWEFAVPSVPLLLCQIALSCADWALAASVCYVLLPSSPSLSYPSFLSVFLLAQVTGIVSQVPGGLGVLETVLLLFLSPTLPAASLAASLVAYRVIYYLLPLSTATVLLAAHEGLRKKEGVRRAAAVFGRWVPEAAPRLLAFTTFVGGAILLLSGATPPVSWRLAWLGHVLPLPVMELSHFLWSLVGMGLLLLAWGLQRRLDAAYLLSTALLSAGIILSLLKGSDYEEAVVLAVMLGALLPCRRHFYRRASLLGQRFTPGWIFAVALVLLGSIWLGIFSYKHVAYSGELWWRFPSSGDAPRLLRATVGAIAVALACALARLLRPTSPAPRCPASPMWKGPVPSSSGRHGRTPISPGSATKRFCLATMAPPSSCTASRGGAESRWVTPSARRGKCPTCSDAIGSGVTVTVAGRSFTRCAPITCMSILTWD
jgi:phosphatidylglycerol lysyltransferase